MRRFYLIVVLLVGFQSAANAVISCRGMSSPLVSVLFNMNWNNAFPITFAGVSAGPNRNPPDMYKGAVCVCPSRLLGIPVPGIMMTMWEPMFVVEIERDPGCSPTLGGKKITNAFNMQLSGPGENAGTGSGAQENYRRQAHWYQYPVFNLLDLFKGALCSPGKGFDIGWITELDAVWQSDLWSIYASPESYLVSNPIAALACSVDAVAANFHFPMDSLFWCLGGSHAYPLSANHASGMGNGRDNLTILGRFLMRQHRLGLLMRTIGKRAECSMVYDPMLPKQQYRIDPIHPFSANGANPIYVGKHPFFWGTFPFNPPPAFESQAYMLWRASQCCIRL